MGEEIHMEISIPTDDDGYALLQCEHCSNFFKAIPSDIGFGVKVCVQPKQQQLTQ